MSWGAPGTFSSFHPGAPLPGSGVADFITNFVQAAIWRVIDELYEYDPKANTFVPRNTRGITHQFANDLVTIHSDPRFTATWTNPAND